MTNYNFVLARRVSVSVLLLAGLLSLEACQLSAPTTQKAATNALNTDAPGSLEKVAVPVERSVETRPVLSVRHPLLQGRLSEKHFVIPVARSGDFAPDELDEYVLNIIEQSRHWEYVSELQVHGHTDSEGSELSNMLLSIRRANRVAERFEELGVEAGLLLIEAHGETQAIADNTTLDGRIANRRIEIVLIGHVGEGADDDEQYKAVVAELPSQGGKP
ncbi:MAG: OmpA family protein [Candidatus Reddybacter sp.]